MNTYVDVVGVCNVGQELWDDDMLTHSTQQTIGFTKHDVTTVCTYKDETFLHQV